MIVKDDRSHYKGCKKFIAACSEVHVINNKQIKGQCILVHNNDDRQVESEWNVTRTAKSSEGMVLKIRKENISSIFVGSKVGQCRE